MVIIQTIRNFNHFNSNLSPQHRRTCYQLNRLKEKSARYTLDKGFLSRCINNKLVPKGLELILEPTIGNYDQSFIDNWYSKLKDFSLNVMEDVVSFCNKTIKETNIKIDQTQGILKQQLRKNEYDEIQNNQSK